MTSSDQLSDFEQCRWCAKNSVECGLVGALLPRETLRGDRVPQSIVPIYFHQLIHHNECHSEGSNLQNWDETSIKKLDQAADSVMLRSPAARKPQKREAAERVQILYLRQEVAQLRRQNAELQNQADASGITCLICLASGCKMSC